MSEPPPLAEYSATPGRQRFFLPPLAAAAAQESLTRLRRLGLSILAVLLIGALGHTLLFGMDFLDALYFQLITITTIGYGEPTGYPLSEGQRVFQMIYIVVSYGLMAYAAATAVQLLLDLDIDPGRMRMNRLIDRMEHHVIVCGSGRVGRHVVDLLREEGTPFVVIEENHELANDLYLAGIPCVTGDATTDAVLTEAHVGQARALLAATGDHAVNAFIVLSSKALNPTLHVVARADDEKDEAKMRKVGADVVIFPTRIGSQAMAAAALRPAVHGFLDWARTLQNYGAVLDEIELTQSTPLAGQTLGATHFRSRYELLAVAVRRRAGAIEFNPTAETRIQGGDTWVVIGPVEQVAAFRENSAHGVAR